MSRRKLCDEEPILIEEVEAPRKKIGRPRKYPIEEVKEQDLSEQIIEIPQNNYRKKRKYVGRKCVEEVEEPIDDTKKFSPQGTVKVTSITNGEINFEDQVDFSEIADHLMGGRIEKVHDQKKKMFKEELNKASTNHELFNAIYKRLKEFYSPNSNITSAWNLMMVRYFDGIKYPRMPTLKQFNRWIDEDNELIAKDPESGKIKNYQQRINYFSTGIVEEMMATAQNALSNALMEEATFGYSSKEVKIAKDITEKFGGPRWQGKQVISMNRVDFGGGEEQARASLDSIISK